MLNITALQSVEEGSQCSTVNFTTRNNCSLDISRLNNEVYGESREQNKSCKKATIMEKKLDDSDLFNFLNNHTKVNNTVSSSSSSSVNQMDTRNDSSLSIVNQFEEDQSSGYETSLSTKTFNSPMKIIDNINNSKGETVITPTTTTTTTNGLLQSEIGIHKSIVLNNNSTEQLTLNMSSNHSSIVNDLRLENKLLRSEVSSLNQEVSGLLRRNHKASEEIKQLTGQVDRLNSQLKDSDTRVRELQIQLKEIQLTNKSNENNNNIIEQLEMKLKKIKSELSTVQSDLCYAQSQLDKNKLTINTLEASLHESRQQALIADKRTELAQNDNLRLARELTQYKEKANHILSMKERVIASLRGQDLSCEGSKNIHDNEEDNSENELINSMRAECDLLREEASRWRLEVDHKEMAIQELELQMQTERESLRRNIELSEEQAEREKQLREDADTELAQLRQSLREIEETFSHQKADLHTKLISSESELNRLRQLASAASSSSSSSNSNKSPNRNDPENIFTLESRIRQLTDNLLSKQDALDSVLAQNHALKIRLDHVMNDNESLVSALSSDDNNQSVLENGRSYHSVGYTCNRLNLHDTPIPRQLRLLAYRIDNFGIRVVNTLRRFPMIRSILLCYILMLHIWILIRYFLPVNNMKIDGGHGSDINSSSSSSNNKLTSGNNPSILAPVNHIS
ncbi:unnamed protein product [Heterobilharzia americana]|nr:unnamed protein product [Heterobilharzia americana]